MTHRERYDPEDIEVLLSEHAFEELLPEERAYVLRHLSGREEYEAMRATLQQIRAQDQRRRPIEPDAHVRQAVLEAFGERHRTGWRYHLNAVGAWLFPPDARGVFRPAMVLGGLALLVVTLVWLLPSAMELPTGPLAEVKTSQEEVPATSPIPKEEPASAETIVTRTNEPAATEQAGEEEDRTWIAEAGQHESEKDSEVRDSRPAPIPAMMDALDDVAESDHRSEAEEVVEQIAMERSAPITATRSESHAMPAAREGSREVRQQELSMNMTMADGSVETAAKQSSAPQMSRTIATDADLLGLLTAAW